MNAFNAVNLSGACLLTSTEFAEELGVPKEKWIYLLGGAGTKDSADCNLLIENKRCRFTYCQKSGNGQTTLQAHRFLDR